MNQRQPDLGQALQQSVANLGSAVVQVVQNLLVAGSVAGQTFQRTVLRQAPRQLTGPFKVDRHVAVTHNAKFQARPQYVHLLLRIWPHFAFDACALLLPDCFRKVEGWRRCRTCRQHTGHSCAQVVDEHGALLSADKILNLEDIKAYIQVISNFMRAKELAGIEKVLDEKDRESQENLDRPLGRMQARLVLQLWGDCSPPAAVPSSCPVLRPPDCKAHPVDARIGPHTARQKACTQQPPRGPLAAARTEHPDAVWYSCLRGAEGGAQAQAARQAARAQQPQGAGAPRGHLHDRRAALDDRHRREPAAAGGVPGQRRPAQGVRILAVLRFQAACSASALFQVPGMVFLSGWQLAADLQPRLLRQYPLSADSVQQALVQSAQHAVAHTCRARQSASHHATWGRVQVTLVIPWVAKTDQRIIFPNNITFDSPAQQARPACCTRCLLQPARPWQMWRSAVWCCRAAGVPVVCAHIMARLCWPQRLLKPLPSICGGRRMFQRRARPSVISARHPQQPACTRAGPGPTTHCTQRRADQLPCTTPSPGLTTSLTIDCGSPTCVAGWTSAPTFPHSRQVHPTP